MDCNGYIIDFNDYRTVFGGYIIDLNSYCNHEHPKNKSIGFKIDFNGYRIELMG